MKSWRIYLVLLLVGLFWLGIFIRLFQIQIVKHNFYKVAADSQSRLFEELTPQRGEIFIHDKDGVLSPLATNRNLDTVFLVPKELNDLSGEQKINIAGQLASLLELDKDNILAKINKINDPYELLKKRVDDETVKKIKDLHFPGIYFVLQGWRWYPQNNLASHLVGFVGFQDDRQIGLYGLEKFYEKKLVGEAGILSGKKDALGRPVLLDMENFDPAKNGSKLILTIDQNIQYLAEEKLKAVIEKWGAEGGSIIVADPKTGAIRAMASWPNYNPNEYFKEKNMDVFLNPVTQKLFEPGSIFKLVTMAAGVDIGKVTPETTYVDTGSLQIGGYKIANAAEKSYGLSSMTRVLEKSINTGAVFVGRAIGHEAFKKYVQAFGFDHTTGVDLNNELAGNISNFNENREINDATASFGQGIAVTPLQVVMAISALANDGKIMKPFLVEKNIQPDNTEIVTRPEVIYQPITAQTAHTLTKMLVSTVENGYDKIKLKNYTIAGKTGTAQIPDVHGYSEETIHSFVGYAPAYDPAFIIFIKMDKPKGIRFASDSLAPVFAEVAQFLFNYYEIPPDK